MLVCELVSWYVEAKTVDIGTSGKCKTPDVFSRCNADFENTSCFGSLIEIFQRLFFNIHNRDGFSTCGEGHVFSTTNASLFSNRLCFGTNMSLVHVGIDIVVPTCSQCLMVKLTLVALMVSLVQDHLGYNGWYFLACEVSEIIRIHFSKVIIYFQCSSMLLDIGSTRDIIVRCALCELIESKVYSPMLDVDATKRLSIVLILVLELPNLTMLYAPLLGTNCVQIKSDVQNFSVAALVRDKLSPVDSPPVLLSTILVALVHALSSASANSFSRELRVQIIDGLLKSALIQGASSRLLLLVTFESFIIVEAVVYVRLMRYISLWDYADLQTRMITFTVRVWVCFIYAHELMIGTSMSNFYGVYRASTTPWFSLTLFYDFQKFKVLLIVLIDKHLVARPLQAFPSIFPLYAVGLLTFMTLKEHLAPSCDHLQVNDFMGYYWKSMTSFEQAYVCKFLSPRLPCSNEVSYYGIFYEYFLINLMQMHPAKYYMIIAAKLRQDEATVAIVPTYYFVHSPVAAEPYDNIAIIEQFRRYANIRTLTPCMNKFGAFFTLQVALAGTLRSQAANNAMLHEHLSISFDACYPKDAIVGMLLIMQIAMVVHQDIPSLPSSRFTLVMVIDVGDVAAARLRQVRVWYQFISSFHVYGSGMFVAWV